MSLQVQRVGNLLRAPGETTARPKADAVRRFLEVRGLPSMAAATERDAPAMACLLGHLEAVDRWGASVPPAGSPPVLDEVELRRDGPGATP